MALLDHLYSCRFSTFLSNSFIERNKLANQTATVWSWVEQRYESFLNPVFDAYQEGPVIPSASPKILLSGESTLKMSTTADSHRFWPQNIQRVCISELWPSQGAFGLMI